MPDWRIAFCLTCLCTRCLRGIFEKALLKAQVDEQGYLLCPNSCGSRLQITVRWWAPRACEGECRPAPPPSVAVLR